jgi:hypothetical protein
VFVFVFVLVLGWCLVVGVGGGAISIKKEVDPWDLVSNQLLVQVSRHSCLRQRIA